MTDTLLKYCEKLPIELVRYILDFKKKHNCIICKKNFEYNIYVKYMKIDLCTYNCYLCYFYGYTFYRSLIFYHIILSPFLCSRNIFFRYYYCFMSILFLFLYIEQYFLKV
jgi:hypothetical protein